MEKESIWNTPATPIFMDGSLESTQSSKRRSVAVE